MGDAGHITGIQLHRTVSKGTLVLKDALKMRGNPVNGLQNQAVHILCTGLAYNSHACQQIPHDGESAAAGVPAQGNHVLRARSAVIGRGRDFPSPPFRKIMGILVPQKLAVPHGRSHLPLHGVQDKQVVCRMKLDFILQIRTVRIQVNAVGMVQALGILLKIGLQTPVGNGNQFIAQGGSFHCFNPGGSQAILRRQVRRQLTGPELDAGHGLFQIKFIQGPLRMAADPFSPHFTVPAFQIPHIRQIGQAPGTVPHQDVAAQVSAPPPVVMAAGRSAEFIGSIGADGCCLILSNQRQLHLPDP